MSSRRTGDDAATWAVVLEELELARRDRAEIRAWMALAVQDLRATMMLMQQQHQAEMAELKKTSLSSSEDRPFGLLNWKALLPPSWGD